MKIICLGYKLSFTNEKMWYYKLEYNNTEHIIIDIGWLILDVKLSNENIIINGNLNDSEKEKIKLLSKSIEKVEKILDDDEEYIYLTKYELKEVEIPKPKDRSNKLYLGDEVNEILNIFNEFDIINIEGKYEEITQEMCDYGNGNNYTIDLLKDLVGYKFKFKTDGFHKNDGQMVTYNFTFISPNKKITEFSTEMCLMVGWNHYNNEKIK